MNNPKAYIDEAMSEENRALRDELHQVIAEKRLLEDRIDELEHDVMVAAEKYDDLDNQVQQGNDELERQNKELLRALRNAENTIDLCSFLPIVSTDKAVIERNLYEVREVLKAYRKEAL